jgi:hypothetical protein
MPAINKKARVGSEALAALKQLNSFYGNVAAAGGHGGGRKDQDQSAQEQILKTVLDITGILGRASNPYGTAYLLRKERARR